MQCAYVFFMILTMYSDLSVRWKIAPTVVTYKARWIEKAILYVARK
jgi:hypothetical protein